MGAVDHGSASPAIYLVLGNEDGRSMLASPSQAPPGADDRKVLFDYEGSSWSLLKLRLSATIRVIHLERFGPRPKKTYRSMSSLSPISDYTSYFCHICLLPRSYRFVSSRKKESNKAKDPSTLWILAKQARQGRVVSVYYYNRKFVTKSVSSSKTHSFDIKCQRDGLVKITQSASGTPNLCQKGPEHTQVLSLTIR